MAEKLIEEVKEEVKGMGLEPERIKFQPMVLPIFKMLPKIITDFTNDVKKLGKISSENRQKLAEKAV
jgi:coenzyme F420-reducing hydrogenase delta subunit